MKYIFSLSLGLVFAAGSTVFAQNTVELASNAAPTPAAVTTQRPVPYKVPSSTAPFSRMAFGAGISPLGIGMEVSTNLNSHLNVRGFGNVFKYSTNFTTSGVPANAKLNLASSGAMADVYPFHSGFRLSGGILFVNDNQLTGTSSMAGGDSITLNGQTYYSANANSVTGATPLTGNGTLSLNGMKPGAVLTTGWGNHVKRSGHWSFPFEAGVAFVGTPKVNVNVGGWACLDQAQTMCTNIADPKNSIAVDFQNNLNAQVQKWNSDLNALGTYPMVSIGVAYSFQVRNNVH